MKQTLMITQLIVGVLASGLILLQAKGTGLGRTIGSTMYHSRRGVENLLFRLTIGLVVLFVVIAIITQFFIPA